MDLQYEGQTIGHWRRFPWELEFGALLAITHEGRLRSFRAVGMDATTVFLALD